MHLIFLHPKPIVILQDIISLTSIPKDRKPIMINSTFHVLFTILKLLAVSAAEAELGALFFNAQQAIIIRLTLEEL